jgi:hypothetical protein
MLFSNNAPVLPSSRMKPLPSVWLSEMSMFSNDTVPRTMLFSWSPLTWNRLTPLDHEGCWLPLWATMQRSMRTPVFL